MDDTKTKTRKTPSQSTSDRLRSFVERIERLAEEKDALSEDLKEVYAEAKALGWNAKVLRIVVKRRKAGSDKTAEQDALISVYEHSLSFKTTPLSLAAGGYVHRASGQK